MIFNVILGSEDKYTVSEQEKVIDFTREDSFSYTFWKDKNLLPHWYDKKALDLLYISLAVFAADRLCLRNDAEVVWSRNIDFHLGVLVLSVWNLIFVLLDKLLSFLSGDFYTFVFREREETDIEKSCYETYLKVDKDKIKDYDRLCMFSGGMDSFIGAIDLLERNEGKTLFVSHYGGGKGTKEFQDALKEKFIQAYDVEKRDFHQYYAKVVAGEEDTTRTRSFMFFSHAIVLASALEKNVEIVIPENGLISLNIPSTFSRLGTSSTRTTHPYYLRMFQELLNRLQLDIHFINPYQFKTKGEMLIECKNKEFVENNLSSTMSCSHPDNGRMLKETEARHCGYCLPCVIRQAAIKRAGMHDQSTYRDREFKIVKEARTILNSYRLGIEKYNPKYAFLTVQQSGPIEEKIEEYANLYVRGMNELKDYLEEI